jgi:hypothetical protein
MGTPQAAFLETPSLPRIVPESVFDAFAWCKSEQIEWRRPRDAWDVVGPIDGTNPARMVFVMRAECTFLPREKAALHAFELGLHEEWALAPYAIDDATDELYARRVRPSDLFWLAADNINALVWGLHDWAHFHNHGPFTERAWTELQCDASALTWLWINRDAIGIDGSTWERVRSDVAKITCDRFAAEAIAFDPELISAERLIAISSELNRKSGQPDTCTMQHGTTS